MNSAFIPTSIKSHTNSDIFLIIKFKNNILIITKIRKINFKLQREYFRGVPELFTPNRQQAVKNKNIL